MASIVEQQPAAGSVESAARQFWHEKMAAHPTIAGLLAIAGEVVGFFLNGHCLVWLGQWIIRVSGSIAETALLFAVLWISGTSVAPGLIELFMSEKTMQYLVWLSLVTLALIPEIILGNAIINAAGRWHTVVHNRENILAWIWAILFTVPTLLFLILTALTLNTLASAGGNFVQASNGLVGLRCFAGWSYGLLELVHVGIGRRTLNQAQPIIVPAQPSPAQIDYQEIARQLLPTLCDELKQAIPDTINIVEQVSNTVEAVYATQLEQLRTHLEEATALLLAQYTAKSEQDSVHEEDTSEDSEQTPMVNIAEDRSDQESEQCEDTASVHNLSPKVTRKLYTKKSSHVSPQNGRGDARAVALRILKKYPDIGPSELAKKAQISRSYANRILAKVNAKETRDGVHPVPTNQKGQNPS
jgi:hypothetical protein